jgi:ketosteroid isomerase-like protein
VGAIATRRSAVAEIGDTAGMSPTAVEGPTDPASDNLALVRRYLRAVESGATGEVLAAFYHPDVVQEELPNRLNPHGARRDLRGILAAAERGKQAVSAQRYQILGEAASGGRVALEVQWSGTVAVPLGTLPAGGELRARFAMFLDLRDGKITAQRNYDCFYPF